MLGSHIRNLGTKPYWQKTAMYDLKKINKLYLYKALFVKVTKKIFVLMLLLIVVYACKKHHNSPSPLSYVPKMAGSHNWHGTENYQCASCAAGPVDTSYSITDSFSINVISDSQIAVTFSAYSSCDTMYYASANTNDNTITFTTNTTNPYNPYYNAMIVYSYLANTIIYQSTTSNPSENWIITLNTP